VTAIPPVRRRLVGAALRRYRENLGYGLEEAARVLDCDRSKISRIETGQRGIRAKELRELLTEYGVAAGEQAALVAIAHRGRQHGWWQAYSDVLTDAGQDFIILEASASEILAYEPIGIPDLLQTEGYARAIAEADPNCTEEEQRAHAVEAKLARQRLVLGERGTRLDVIIGEGALHQVISGCDVMRPQLTRLASQAETGAGSIGVQVLPFAAGAHAASGYGPMSILRFTDTPSLGVVHLAGLSGGVSLEGQEDVVRYIRAFAGLRAAALSHAASARLLRDMARD